MTATVRWPWLLGVAAAAGAAGFGLSRCATTTTPPTPDAPKAPTAVAASPTATAAGFPVDLGRVKVPASYLASANIGVEPVAVGSVAAELLVPAVVDATPGAEASVVARAAGTLKRIDHHLGDDVRAGETLGLVESFEATTMTMDRRVAAAKVTQARQVYAREASLYRQGVSPRQDMEAAQAQLAVAEAEAGRAQAVAGAARVTGDGRSLALVSPIAGRITASTATLGAYVEPQAEVFRVAQAGAVHVEASLPVTESGRVAAGSGATIVTADGTTIPGEVHAVTPAVDPHTQAVTAVVLPTRNTPALHIGEGVRVRLHVGTGAPGSSQLVVPEDAVQNLDGRDALFVRTADGFRAMPVLVGARSGGLAEIVSGVAPGTRVATRNAFLLKAEMLKTVGDEE